MEAKPEAKPEAKTEVKQETKPEPKAAPKPEPKPVVTPFMKKEAEALNLTKSEAPQEKNTTQQAQVQ